ncbi:MAG TPA: Hsp20/alpha crystallin family protein [Meiothermus sp.]|jgi:HSP20 family protein|nr:Hsp20/alpha crystallin family protein [Meiothermus sp.]
MLIRREINPAVITPFREVERLFEKALGELLPATFTPSYVVPANLFETKEAVVLLMEVPALVNESLEINLEGFTLTVKGELKPFVEEEILRTYFQEIPYGAFVRTFTLPVEVEPETIKAEVKNGILYLYMPKPVQTRARRIPVTIA